ncbi:DNA ligase D [Niastella sp. OAS944]|uniref:DNA ligase D n=1 Tax=Niastella sp. OAS944 TaxID=2664089 RepID=UPI0034937E01|nr:bifunctional non-homologous end joining protein LigD [Chitinophagaceae bacterium OAS944]
MATITHRKKRTASSARKRKSNARIANLKKLGVQAKLPSTVSPMLATLVDQPFDAENWLFEVKWDGYRAIAICDKRKVSLISRNNKSFNEKFYPITAALQQLKLHAVLDGEIIISNKEGVSSFGDLQNWRSEADGELLYYVFDLLWLNGRQLYEVPLALRRELLKEILPASPVVQLSQTFNAPGTSFYQVAREMNMEGILAKKADSLYLPGVRTKDWLKIKIAKRQEVVIGGYTLNEGSTKLFSSLLVGVFENGQLHYTGKIGTGFTDKVQRDMMQQFKQLVQKTCPFENEPDYNKPSRFRPNPPKATATWLKPQLVCEVSFAEITSDGVMRHPSFEGMRIDKKAKDVKADKAKPTKKVIKESILHKEKIITRRQPGERKTLLNPGEKQQERSINGYTLKFTNLNKIYWPKDKITKRDMLNYYYQVAPVILPYLKDRPQSLNRYPNGITGESFYQKNVMGKIPEWIDTFPYTSEGIKKSFMVPTREADVLYMASLGCIEMNPWSSTVKKPDNPDWCAIDLDPDTNTFEQVIKTAQVTHEVLDSAGIANYCKTSGSTGIHIYIPLGAKYLYEDSREFGRLIATIIHEQIPRFTSIERATADRKGKIYIDFLQNRPQATLACAYSLRPKPGATVSMPLHWEEVKKGLKMKDFNIRNAVGRIKEEGDIFKPVLDKGINMKKAIASLERLFR